MLRSSTELLRYDVEAAAKKIGNVVDYYYDQDDWTIRSIAVDTDGVFGDDAILVDTRIVGGFEFPAETIVLDGGATPVEDKLRAALTVPAQPGDPPVLPSHPSGILHSLAALQGCSAAAQDGRLGHIHGLLIETAAWSIRYFIIDPSDLSLGGYVLLSPVAVESVDWGDRAVRFSVTRDAVERSPPYDTAAETTRQYEAFLHDYYGRHKYWK